MEEQVDKLGEVTKEFKDKVDFCLGANIPVPPFDVQLFPPLRYPFMIGPVPLTLGNFLIKKSFEFWKDYRFLHSFFRFIAKRLLNSTSPMRTETNINLLKGIRTI